MPEVRFSILADADVDEIYEYSLEQFGEEIADRYFRTIFDRCETALRHPELTLSLESTRKNLRRITCESHAIFFEQAQNGDVYVVRILHQSMDLQKYLGD